MSEEDQAKSNFGLIGKEFDTTEPLKWCFVLSEAKEDQLVPLMNALTELGFRNVHSGSDEDDVKKRYLIWFEEVCVHTAESYTARVAVVESFAARQGVELSNYSAGSARKDLTPQPPPFWLRALFVLLPILGLVLAYLVLRGF